MQIILKVEILIGVCLLLIGVFLITFFKFDATFKIFLNFIITALTFLTQFFN